MISDNNWVGIIKDSKVTKHLILKMEISGKEQLFATSNLEVIDATTTYKVGTVTVTNLSKSLTFVGSSLLGNVEDGGLFRITSNPNAPFYETNAPTTNTALALKTEYLEATESAKTYEVLTDFVIKKFKAGLGSTGNIVSSIDLDTLTSRISSIKLSIDGSHALQNLRTTFVLTNMTAELGLWVEGMLYQDRLQLGEGVIRNISWGDTETNFTFNLLDLRKNLDRKFPSVRITSENFSGANAQVIGNSYPVLYGSVIDSPCFYIGQPDTDHRWLVAGHDINGISTARHNGSTFSPSDSGTATDGDGNTYFFIESASDFSTEAVTVDANGTKDGSSFFSNAGEIIEDIVTDFSGLDSGQIDSGAFGTAKNKLAGWSLASIFNGAGKTEATVFDTIQRRLAPQLPIVPVWRNGKYGIIVIDLDNPVPIIKLKRNKNIIARSGLVTETDVTKVKNSFEINYGYNPRLGQYTKYKKLDNTGSRLLQISQDRYGLLEAPVLNANDIQSNTTADRWLEFQAILRSETLIIITYDCTHEASIVEEGDMVSVTDVDQSWTDKFFICIQRSFNLESVKLTLREIRWTEST